MFVREIEVVRLAGSSGLSLLCIHDLKNSKAHEFSRSEY